VTSLVTHILLTEQSKIETSFTHLEVWKDDK
jgi:hypothetical protein